MITFQEFEKLNEQQRANRLWKEGTYLDLSRKTEKLIVDLYGIGDFYVEVFFDSFSEELLYVKPFYNLERLSPYLENIDISNIVSA